MSHSLTFHKAERLKNHKLLTQIFKTGNSFSFYPLLIVYTPIPYEGAYPVQFALSVPKRKFPKAVQRNRIRRQMREAYRLHKHLLYEQRSSKPRLAIMVIYVAKEAKKYSEIEKAMKRILKKLSMV